MEAVNEEAILNNWVNKQITSKKHILAIFLFSIITFFSFASIFAVIIGYLVFFLVTALPRVYKMLFVVLIVGILSAIFPFLGIIFTVVFFLVRINYIISNWRGLLAGLVFYTYPLFLILIVPKTNPYSFDFYNLFSFYYFTPYFAVITAIAAGLALHFLLKWLYSHQYSSDNALGTMGAAPLFVIMIILPFIIDDIAEVIEFDDFNEFESAQEMEFENVDYDDPGIHNVEGHWRQLENGEYTYVESHMRTNPDGIESNNMSAD